MTTAETPHCLLNQTIVAILVADDGDAIKFVLADGREVIAICDGDCCSSTWIEEVNDPEAALGLVTKAEDIELPEEFQQATKTTYSEDEMKYYGFAIETPRGRCLIAYRNSSNGYYGGRLMWSGDHYAHYNLSNTNWKPLTGEFGKS